MHVSRNASPCSQMGRVEKGNRRTGSNGRLSAPVWRPLRHAEVLAEEVETANGEQNNILTDLLLF